MESYFKGMGTWAFNAAWFAILVFTIGDMLDTIETGPSEPQPMGSPEDVEFFSKVIATGIIWAILGAGAKLGVNTVSNVAKKLNNK